MNMISFLNTSDRTAWTQTGPEKPFGFSGPVPCLCNTNIPAIDYFLIRPWQKARVLFRAARHERAVSRKKTT